MRAGAADAMAAVAELCAREAGGLPLARSPRADAARDAVFRRHAPELYGTFGAGRIEHVFASVAAAFPGVLPSPADLAAERALPLSEQRGVAVPLGQFAGALLESPSAGRELIEAMLRPLPESLALLPQLAETGTINLGCAALERRGELGVVTVERGERLNAENDATTAALERAVDLVALDPAIRVGVLRGGIVTHPRYSGRRVFSSGLDLTELHSGQLSYLFFLLRELGFMSKIQRGPKPWVAAVETFAIGGGCQLLLVVDRVVAEAEAVLSLPASREGLVPGLAPLRLPHFVGTLAARRAILFGASWHADSRLGHLLCDDVVGPEAVDAAVERAAAALVGLGWESLLSNRRALLEAREPVDAYRRAMARYARDQAACLTSRDLADRLERSWVRRHRAGAGPASTSVTTASRAPARARSW
jgi:thioesterase DpgC